MYIWFCWNWINWDSLGKKFSWHLPLCLEFRVHFSLKKWWEILVKDKFEHLRINSWSSFHFEKRYVFPICSRFLTIWKSPSLQKSVQLPHFSNQGQSAVKLLQDNFRPFLRWAFCPKLPSTYCWWQQAQASEKEMPLGRSRIRWTDPVNSNEGGEMGNKGNMYMTSAAFWT